MSHHLNTANCPANRRLLVVDDNQAIHDDYRKILAARVTDNPALDAMAAELFDETIPSLSVSDYRLDFAFQGEQALSLVQQALAEGEPYAAVFMDIRMPPGWDGVETAQRIWRADPDLQIVICTAYSDYSWEQIREQLGHSAQLVVLKKPFDHIEVLQLAEMLTEKWRMAQQLKQQLLSLENIIQQRSSELQESNANLQAANRQLMAIEQGAQYAMDTQARYRRVLAGELHQALEQGQFSLHYQPLIDVATQRIVSLEALLRWHHPREGWIPPMVFIPVAEESGFILQLGEFVLRTVCEQVVSWRQAGIAVVPVAVNVSAVQLERENMWKQVRKILRETHMRPEHLALEITESSLIKDAHHHIKRLHGLRRDGVRILIDDFGTGYSSLSYLKQLPIDTLKIDRSFINQVDTNPQDEAIVIAILTMAHSLGFKVVAEGVETVSQLNVLRKYGCEVAQGYLFSRPVTAESCGELLRTQLQPPWLKLSHPQVSADLHVFPARTAQSQR